MTIKHKLKARLIRRSGYCLTFHSTENEKTALDWFWKFGIVEHVAGTTEYTLLPYSYL